MYVKTKTGINKILPESLEEREQRRAHYRLLAFERARAAERARSARKDNPK